MTRLDRIKSKSTFLNTKGRCSSISKVWNAPICSIKLQFLLQEQRNALVKKNKLKNHAPSHIHFPEYSSHVYVRQILLCHTLQSKNNFKKVLSQNLSLVQQLNANFQICQRCTTLASPPAAWIYNIRKKQLSNCFIDFDLINK